MKEERTTQDRETYKAGPEEVNELFPVFLRMDKLHTLVVGGGKVGLEKLQAVYQNSPGAWVTLVAPEIAPEILQLGQRTAGLRLIRRGFEEGDLEGMDLVILATEKRPLNEFIQGLAREHHILTNVADSPDICDFYLGSVVRKGSLKIAVSTNGKSPTVSKRIRQVLEDTLPGELQQVLNNLQHIRRSLGGDFTNKVRTLNRITSVLVDRKESKSKGRTFLRILLYSLLIIGIMIAGYFLIRGLLSSALWHQGFKKG